jgi:hypothetical protein
MTPETKAILLVDLKDLYNLTLMGTSVLSKWESLRSNHIDGLKTVWQRSVEIQPVENTIVEYLPTTFTLLQMINELSETPYFRYIRIKDTNPKIGVGYRKDSTWYLTLDLKNVKMLEYLAENGFSCHLYVKMATKYSDEQIIIRPAGTWMTLISDYEIYEETIATDFPD